MKISAQHFHIAQNAELQHFTVNFAVFLQRIYEEKPFQSVYLQRRSFSHCIVEDMPQLLTLPFIISDGATEIYLKHHYNSELLAIVCLQTWLDTEMLLQLALQLQHMRTTRIVAVINDANTHNSTMLTAFFQHCAKLKLISVNLLQRDSFTSQRYLSYTQFPSFALETYDLSSKTIIFPQRLNNFHGKTLLTLTDQIEPRTMVYTDAAGRQRMSGYVGKFMSTFAERYNCTLQLPYPYNMSNERVVYLLDVRDAALNESIDVGTSLVGAGNANTSHSFTYPMEISDWQLMVPVTTAVPINVLLQSVFKPGFIVLLLLLYFLLSLLTAVFEAHDRRDRVILLDLFCNNATLRGILGQSFVMRRNPNSYIKFIYFLTFLAGLLFSTYFVASFVKLLTVPPLEEPYQSYNSLLRHKVKVRVSKPEVKLIMNSVGEEFWQEYESLFDIMETYDEFQVARRTLVTPYAYPVTGSLWPVIAERQRYFASDVYRLSKYLYFSKFLLFALPLNENSYYKDALNPFIMNVHATGLWNFWFRMTFYDMAALKRVSFEDISVKRTYQPLELAHFGWIWTFYGVCICLTITVFALEQCGWRNRVRSV